MFLTTKAGRILSLLILFAAVLIISCRNTSVHVLHNKPDIIMDIPGYPVVFELNRGDTMLIDREHNGHHTEKIFILKDIRLFSEINNWFPDSVGKWNYFKAELDIVISGKPYMLTFQPYQMPQVIDGLKIYTEGIKEAGYDRSLRKDARFSVCLEDESWGVPAEFEFPVNDFRFRSSAYNNTWFSLVPFNSFRYYHMGEDLGAIPDKLEVCSWNDGEVIMSPVPGGSNSNSIAVRSENGIVFDYHHCNIETIDTGMIAGYQVRKGEIFAKTGMTWDNRHSQWMDPHIHLGMSFNRYEISLYPYLVDAYLRKYDDYIIAVAGGYRFAQTGDSIEINALRSICRNTDEKISYRWILHDGSVIDKPVVKVKYDSPGFYSEELIVTTGNGKMDKDFLQVRVNDPGPRKDFGWGWTYSYPVRNIRPGQQVLFHNRITQTRSDVLIDFGDGTEPQVIKEEAKHSYSAGGNYTVKFTATGTDNAPVCVKLEVIID